MTPGEPIEKEERVQQNYSKPQREEANGNLQPARVKWFDKLRGFGFANVFGSKDDVFVHMEVLRQCNIADLQPGEAVALKSRSGPRGRMASEIRPWESASAVAFYNQVPAMAGDFADHDSPE